MLKRGTDDKSAFRWRAAQERARREANVVPERTALVRRVVGWLKGLGRRRKPASEPVEQTQRNRAERRALVRLLGPGFRPMRLRTHMRRPLQLRRSTYCLESRCQRHHAGR